MILHFGFSIQKHASIGTPSILLATTVSRTPSLFIQRHRQRQLLRRPQSNCFYFEYWRIDCVHLKRDYWCTKRAVVLALSSIARRVCRVGAGQSTTNGRRLMSGIRAWHSIYTQ
jgi:hypothetical protein